MTGIIEDIASFMVAGSCQKALKADAIMQVLARMYLVAQVHAAGIKFIEDRYPSCSKFFESGFY